MPEIANLNHRHQGILRWLLANPAKPLSECASELGYTLPWLSTIIHSHAFQCELRKAQAELSEEVALDLKDKLTGVAHMALDKLIVGLPAVNDPEKVLDIATKTLKSLGYGAPPRAGNTTNIQVNGNVVAGVSQSDLQRAREMAMAVVREEEKKVATPSLPAPVTAQ